MICLLMLLTVSALIQGMYVESNLTSSNVKTIETNPAIWTEEGLWGPLLEDWTIGHQRYVIIIDLRGFVMYFN